MKLKSFLLLRVSFLKASLLLEAVKAFYIKTKYYVKDCNINQTFLPRNEKNSHHGKIDIAGVELHVNLLVDKCFAVFMKVLSDLWRHVGYF